ESRKDRNSQIMKIRTPPPARGSALLITLLTAFVIGLALSSYLLLVANQNVANMRSLAWNSAMPVIEGGIEEALTQLEFNDIQHLSANQWTDLGNGWFYKSRYLDSRSYYEVMIQQVDPPIIVSTGSLPAPLAPPSSFGMILGSIVPNSAPACVRRRVQVNTVKKPLLPYAMLAQAKIDLSGGGVSTDAFDSSDPMFSTSGKYDPAKNEASVD